MPNTMGGIQGAAGGALAGSAFGPAGTLIGGGIGFLGGFLGGDGDPYSAEKRAFMNETKRRQAPQLGPAYNGSYSGFRNNQSNMIRNLEMQAAGKGPSVSREMLNQATNRATQTQNAMTATGQGNAALSGMTAANNIGRIQSDAAGQAALGRAQEQANAQNQLGLAIYGARGADEDMNRFNASAQNGRQEFNVGNQMNMTNMNDRNRLALMGMPQGGPSMGEQILSGGAQARAWYDSQNGQNR